MNAPEMRTRALRLADEDELKKAVGDPHARIIEWASVGLTFVRSDRQCVIARTGALGGDVRQVHGGWFYLNTILLAADWQEILYVAKAFTPPTEIGGLIVRGGENS